MQDRRVAGGGKTFLILSSNSPGRLFIHLIQLHNRVYQI